MLLYEKIVSDIMARLHAGELLPGSLLPSIDELHANYGVSHITATRVYRELKASGIAEKYGRTYRVRLPESVNHNQFEEERKMTLGVFLRPFRGALDFMNDHYMDTINLGVEQAIIRSQHDYLRTFAIRSFRDLNPNMPDSVSIVATNLNCMAHRTVGILVDEQIPDEAIALFRKENDIPVVLVNRESSLPISSVTCDNQDAVELLLRQALRQGYGRVCYCDGGESNYWNDQTRRNEFFRLKREGNELELLSIDLLASDFLQNAKALVAAKPDSKVLFFCNHDFAAVNICEGLLSQGAVPGKDCGVCGFYGCGSTYDGGRPLTSIRFDAAEIGRQAVRVLLNRIRFAWDYQPEHVRMPGEFVLGDSM